MATLDPGLAARAKALGVATCYTNWAGETVDVDPAVVQAVVDMLGSPAAPQADADGSAEAGAAGAPAALALPPPCWGWSIQVYALHSEKSWGVGDFADLRTFVDWSGRAHGADLVLVNPLHAVVPVHPITASPYSPTSRRFINPLYLHIEDLPEYESATAAVRAQVDALRLPPPSPDGLIDWDAVWAAKAAALQLLWPFARHEESSPELRDFATFCALAEELDLPWQQWPSDFRDPRGAGVSASRTRLSDRVAFHAWLQLLCDEQLGAVQAAANDAGMRIGLVHDLAVGVDPGGADSWALQDVLAGNAAVGAPPDSYNQLGQNWALPPWRPDALARSNYGPYRAMLEAILRRGGGVRVDHVMGLSRLWWVPRGNTADKGTYVSYDRAAMLDILVESARAREALVVGEDLGTVEPQMREALSVRGILGSAVFWFERSGDALDGPITPPGKWREGAMASISTHDLPTAHGFLAGEHVRVRAELGQLGQPVEQEQAKADADKAVMIRSLIDEGVLDPAEQDDPDAVTLAMHRFLGRTPARVLIASPYDVLGELRQPNLPGTTDEYPNWCIPFSCSLAEMMADPRMAATANALRRRDGRQPGG